MVHGLVVASRSVAPLLEALDRHGFEAWCPDLPGFGLSTKPERALSVVELAEALGRWLVAIDLGPVHLVGNSFGSQIATALAASSPELVERLVLLAPTVDPTQRRLGSALAGGHPERLAGAMVRWRPQLAAVATKIASALAVPAIRHSAPRTGRPSLALITVVEWLTCGLARAAGTVGACLGDAIEDRLSKVQAPTLVLRANKDHVTRPAWIDRIEALLARSQCAVIAGYGHSAQFHAGEEIAEAIAPFLRQSAGQ